MFDQSFHSFLRVFAKHSLFIWVFEKETTTWGTWKYALTEILNNTSYTAHEKRNETWMKHGKSETWTQHEKSKKIKTQGKHEKWKK